MHPTPAAIRRAFREIESGVTEIALRHFDHLSSAQVEEKSSHRDLLTVADSACEAHVIAVLQRHFPEDLILGEESGALIGKNTKSRNLWIIDPIDGTTNFARSFPFFATSVGLVSDGEPFAGLVVAPRLGETFEAIKGEGATLNGAKIAVSQTAEIKRAILATGFSYNRNEVTKNNVDNFSKLILEAHDIRRAGAASLDLCYVAAGRFDGYWEAYLKPWDIAGGAIIVQEAGGVICDFSSGLHPSTWLWEENLVAANPKLLSPLQKALSGVEEAYQPLHRKTRDQLFGSSRS